MTPPLDRVAHLLVTPSNPPTSDVDGMDSGRCLKLHNAIFEHGWVSSGRSADDFHAEAQTWADHHDQEDFDRFHSSLQTFLGGALVLPGKQDQQNLFYSVSGLQAPSEWMWSMGECIDDPDPDRVMNLYATYSELASHAQGMLYDQHLHKAIMHFSITDDFELDSGQPWQPLETILSVWIGMIQQHKVIALPDEIGKDEYLQDENSVWQHVVHPERDPTTGAKRLDAAMQPWTMAPWTLDDLESCLSTWYNIVSVIEDKMSLEQSEHTEGILDNTVLDAAALPEGFARSFLSRARKPRFDYIAPGLHVPAASDFPIQPFLASNSAHVTSEPDASSDSDIFEELPPILLFRGEAKVNPNGLAFHNPYDKRHSAMTEIPCGLYLDTCYPNVKSPFEDAARLVLPFRLDAGWMKLSDYSPSSYYQDWSERQHNPIHDDLLQTGVNPYNQPHSAKLKAFLYVILANVEQGTWAVGERGILDGIEKWKDADTEEGWQDYWVPLDPGCPC